MAITGYTGLPGSGKSYTVVEHVVLPALEMGKRVWTNIPLNIDQFPQHQQHRITHFDVADIQQDKSWFQTVFEKGAVCVIDECWRLWPSGMKANAIEEGHKSFFAEHRHMVGEDGFSTEIVLVTQGLDQIASFFRNLVETTYRCTKLTAVGSSKRYRLDIYSGPVTGPKPPVSQRLREIPGKYRKEVYKLYKSHTMSDGGAGNEQTSDSRKSILKGAKFKVILAAVIILPILSLWGLSDVYRKYAAGDLSGNAPQAVEAGSGSSAPRPPSKPRVPKLLSGKRLSIAFNMGVFPNIEYRILIQKGDHRAIMTQQQLMNLGYKLLAFSDCVVRIKGHDFDDYVFCEQEPEREDLVNFDSVASID